MKVIQPVKTRLQEWTKEQIIEMIEKLCENNEVVERAVNAHLHQDESDEEDEDDEDDSDEEEDEEDYYGRMYGYKHYF